MPESIWCREHQIEVEYVRSQELSWMEYVLMYGVDPHRGRIVCRGDTDEREIPQQPPMEPEPWPEPEPEPIPVYGPLLTADENAWLEKIILESKRG